MARRFCLGEGVGSLERRFCLGEGVGSLVRHFPLEVALGLFLNLLSCVWTDRHTHKQYIAR